jgi:hypothetical protein
MTNNSMIIFQQVKQLTFMTIIYYKLVSYCMSLRVQCKNHKKLSFMIPQNIDEAIELNSFSEIKKMAHHLENYPSCKMIRTLNNE